MHFDRKKFFDGYRSQFGKLSQIQVTGLSQLLDFIEADRFITEIPWAAYMLATTKHETADTFHPIHEYGGKAYFIKRYGGQTRKGKELGNDTPEEGYFYAGQGYPQTTGESNFEKAEDAIRKDYPEVVADFERRTGKRFDLTVGDQPNDEADPANMMDPAIAYVTMSIGMRTGMFTGKKFTDYSLKTVNYIKWRAIINGTDKANTIATFARKFETILTAAEIEGDGIEEPLALEQLPLKTTEASLVPVLTPAIAVPQVSPAVDQPKEDKPPEESTLMKIGNKANAAYTAFGTMLAGIIAWFASATPIIIASVMGTVTILGGLYMIINWRRSEAKEKRDKDERQAREARELELKKQREQQAFELQKLTLESAMRKDLHAVTIVPTPIENSDSATEGIS